MDHIREGQTDIRPGQLRRSISPSTMKVVIIAIAAFLSSCSPAPKSREIQSTPAASPKQLQLNIPKGSWPSLFFKHIDERAELNGLKSLRTDPLPNGDFEVRVWHGFGLTPLEGFVLRRTGDQWSASFLKGVTPNAPPNELIQTLPEPKSGWGGCWRRLDDAGLFTLPDATAIHCLAGVNDGAGYVVELNRDGVYRTYMYENPDYALR